MNVSSKDWTASNRKRRPFRRLHNPAKARSDDVYSIREIANLYEVEEETVRNWLKEGLKTVIGASRILVRGDVLKSFHDARNKRARKPMTETQFQCLHCRVPREPALGSVIGATTPSVRLTARCNICNKPMYRFWSRSSAAALQASPNLCASQPNTAPETPSDGSDTRQKMSQIATSYDSMIQNNTIAASEANKTAEGHLNTKMSDQFSLPFGF